MLVNPDERSTGDLGDCLDKERKYLASDNKDDGKIYVQDEKGDIKYGLGVIKDDETTRKNHDTGTNMVMPDPTSVKGATEKINTIEEIILTVPKK